MRQTAKRAEGAPEPEPNATQRARDQALESGLRLRVLRVALDLSATEAALRFGVLKSTWHAYEQQRATVPPALALRLRVAAGITLDWLYTGDVTLLPGALRRSIRRAMKALEGA